MVDFSEGASAAVNLPSDFNALIYVLNGELETNEISIAGNQMAVFNHDGEAIELKARQTGKALLLAGQPITEPIASYGPFVMNYPGEIKQAILDYETGKMGVLES
jgi:hypothetical protein